MRSRRGEPPRPEPVRKKSFGMVGGRETRSAVTLGFELTAPPTPRGLVIVPVAAPNGPPDPRPRKIAGLFEEKGLATLLVRLPSGGGRTLVEAVDWAASETSVRGLPVGLFSIGPLCAVVLRAAAARPKRVAALVLYAGRPDLAQPVLGRVRAPTLLLVPADDRRGLKSQREALARMACETALEVVAGGGRPSTRDGALAAVAALALGWFLPRFAARAAPGS